MGIRRKGRECALQALYQIDVGGGEVERALHLFWKHFAHDEEVRTFCERLVRGVVEHSDRIDGLIEKFTQHWKIGRMTHIDRNALRIAVYELAFCQDIPPKVTMNEAVDIGKKFGSEDSGAFINGILDQISHHLQQQETCPD